MRRYEGRVRKKERMIEAELVKRQDAIFISTLEESGLFISILGERETSAGNESAHYSTEQQYCMFSVG